MSIFASLDGKTNFEPKMGVGNKYGVENILELIRFVKKIVDKVKNSKKALGWVQAVMNIKLVVDGASIAGNYQSLLDELNDLTSDEIMQLRQTVIDLWKLPNNAQQDEKAQYIIIEIVMPILQGLDLQIRAIKAANGL